MRILVGIVTYNRLSTLVKSIDAHIREGIHETDILVVDNKSTDDTLAVISQKYPLLKTISNSDNIGSAGGFAVCMAYARDNLYDFVWLYNDDSRPISGANSLMRKILDRLNSVPKKTGMLKMGMLRNGMAEILNWRGRRVPCMVPVGQQPIETDLITFDGCLLSVEMIRQIGTCNPRYFMGIYEFDYCLRARDFGFAIYTLPAGLIDDEKKGSTNGSPYWRMYYVTRNHLYLAITRRSVFIFWNFFVLECKKVYSIIFFQKDKRRKLQYKLKAIWHACLNKMGRRVLPN